MALADAIKTIEDALVQRLIDSAIPGIKGIAFNRELRDGDFNPPYIHVFPTPSPINATVGLAISEEWTFNYEIMAVAASYATADRDEARQIALLASSAIFFDPIGLVQDRTLNNNVCDMVRTIWHSDFTKELPDTRQLFGAAMEIAARTILKEV